MKTEDNTRLRFSYRRALITSTIALSILLPSIESFGFDATIRWNELHQRITGFGASTAWSSSNVQRMAEPIRTQLLDDLFDTTTGAGLSMVRALIPYRLLDASGVWNWTTDDAQVWMMQEAQKRGVTFFWGAPWSPPPWMKSNNSSRGGYLLPANYQKYAEYLTRYATEYQSRFQIPISGISVQNEPHFSPSWDGCEYSGAQIRDFIKNNLGPTLRAGSPNTTIIAPETNWNQREWAEPTLNDPAAAQYLGVVALHHYEDQRANPYPLVKSLKKELWESECSWAGDAGPSMRGAALWFKARHDLLTLAEVNAWHFWWFFDPKPDGEGLLNPGPNGGYITTKRLWTLGNYSKFVRPGWHMMGLPRYYSSDSLLSVSAFRDSTSGKFAIIAANFDLAGGPVRTLTINLDGFKASTVTPWLTDETHDLVKQSDITVVGGSFQVSVPAMSVFTYAGIATQQLSSSVRVDSFTCKTEAIIAGQQDTLVWATSNGASVVIDNGIGAMAASGQAVIAPTVSTIYTLTASGTGGPVTRKVVVTVVNGRTPENPTNVNNGLDYTYYETSNNTLINFSAMTPVKSGALPTFSTASKNRSNDYSFSYKGYLDVPVDGVYEFSVKSCSNVALLIGSTQVTYWDFYGGNFGGMGEPVIGTIGLKAGKHAISVGLHYAFGCSDQSITVNWKVPGQQRVAIPPSRIYHIGSAVVTSNPSLIQRFRHYAIGTSMSVYNLRGQLAPRTASVRTDRAHRISGVYIVSPDKLTGVRNQLRVIVE